MKNTTEQLLEKHSYQGTVRQIVSELAAEFVGREEEAMVAVLGVITRNHVVLIGEPGTAKSALLRSLSDRIGGSYYYYLMSKYTIPDELVGPIDPIAYRAGKFQRIVSHWLPTAHIAFIDEVFKGSSQTLNTLLNVMNERKFIDIDGTEHNVPLISMFAASNELPQGEELQAFYDRILLKHFVQPVPPDKLKEGILLNMSGAKPQRTGITLEELNRVYDEIREYAGAHKDSIAGIVSTIVSTMRANGIFISDRTAMGAGYLPFLVAAYSWLNGINVKRAAMEVAKYIIQDNDEQLNALHKSLQSIYPSELSDAMTRIEKLDDLIKAGNLGDAEKTAMEALSITQQLVNKDNMMDLYQDEINEALASIRARLQKILDAKKLIQG